MNLPAAYISHRASPRTRFKIPAKRGDAAYFDTLAENLRKLPAVERVESNPLTASVLLFHDSPPESIAGYAAEQGLFQLESLAERAGPPFMERMVESVKSLNQRISTASGGDMDLKGVVFVNLIGMALFQIRKGNVMAPASTLLWYALSLLIFAQNKEKPRNDDIPPRDQERLH